MWLLVNVDAAVVDGTRHKCPGASLMKFPSTADEIQRLKSAGRKRIYGLNCLAVRGLDSTRKCNELIS